MRALSSLIIDRVFFPTDDLDDFAISKVNIELDAAIPPCPSFEYLPSDDEDGEDRETMRGNNKATPFRLIPIGSRAGVDIFMH